MKKTGYGLEENNSICITGVAETILSLLNVPAAGKMAEPIPEVLTAAAKKFGTPHADRVVMYNPDAIAMWLWPKYAKYLNTAEAVSDLKLSMLSVFPPVTPVCFASMYSGLMPAEHGIQAYVKPVLICDTVFDCLIRAGKKPAIVSTAGDSISEIFLKRKMDYFIYPTVKECNEKAKELIQEDQYDLIVLYNADYDYWMHRVSPAGPHAVKALKSDSEVYAQLHSLIESEWGHKHHTAYAFAPDHGCHRALFPPGNHGINAPCDMNIHHLWSFID